MKDDNWVCYFIMALGSNKTYIGSTNNFQNRLNNHNNANPNIKRKGAKITAGDTWVPVLIINGFDCKRSCLSFESGWKRLSKNRSNDRFDLINIFSNVELKYSGDTKYNRILDLIYFVYNFTFIETKFIMNKEMKLPLYQPYLFIDVIMEEWIENMTWPHFVSFN